MRDTASTLRPAGSPRRAVARLCRAVRGFALLVDLPDQSRPDFLGLSEGGGPGGHGPGLGRRHAGVLVLARDRHIRVLTTEGELLRELTLDPSRDYQPQARP